MIYFSPVDPGGGGGGSGVTDHGALTGLADNDHPHYALDADFDAHTGDSTDVHGIADTSALETQSGAQTKADDAQSAAESTAASALSTHEADTTSIHGIGDTANILLKTLADAKGDLLVATAADTIARKAVGANGTLLVANSGDASGVEWRTLADGDIPAAIARDAEVTSAIGTHEADTTSVHGIADTSTLYRSGGTDVALADGGTGASLVDPNADRILFWDDSAGAFTWLTIGSGLSITDTTIAATGGAGDLTVVGGSSLFVLAADDPSTAATTNRNVTGFTWSMLANALYVVECWGLFSPAAATTGIAFAFDTSVAVTRMGLHGTHQLATTGTLTAFDSIADAAARGLSSGTPAIADTPFGWHGSIKNGGSAGTVQVVWRPEVAAVATLRANTVMKVTRAA